MSSERNGFKRDEEEMNYRQMRGPHMSSFAVKWGKEIGVVSVWNHISRIRISILPLQCKFLEAGNVLTL